MSGATVTASACTGVDGFGCVLTGQRAWVGVVGVHFARANACAGQAPSESDPHLAGSLEGDLFPYAAALVRERGSHDPRAVR